jgi:hypothetical protein
MLSCRNVNSYHWLHVIVSSGGIQQVRFGGVDDEKNTTF